MYVHVRTVVHYHNTVTYCIQLSHLTGSLLSGKRAKRERNSTDRAVMSPEAAGTGGDFHEEELARVSD